MVLSGQAPDTTSLVDRFAPNKVCITAEMADHVDTYINHIRSRALPTQHIEFPVRFNLTTGIDVVGTSDAVGYDGETLYVDDLKFGYRLVDAQDNWQLLAYAMGAVITLHPDPLPERVIMSIVQPRPYHPKGTVRSWELPYAALNEKFNQLVAAAQRALEPNAVAQTGEHCGYCAAFLECPAARNAGYNAVDVACWGSNEKVTPESISTELTVLKRVKAVIDARFAAFEAEAKERIRAGAVVPGWGVERSFGHTKWLDTATPDMLEMMTGKVLTEKKLITPAAAKRAGVDEAVLKTFTYRPDNGFKLVPVDVDRQAKEMFGND
jgi:hypothetical protein